MKNNILIISVVIALASACQPTKKETTEVKKEDISTIPTLTKVWETDTIMTTAEAVIYDQSRDRVYVSNINGIPPIAKDDDGFISILSTDGKVINHQWVTGISAPKGMGILEDKLYVTNIDEVVEIDIESGQITNRFAAEDALFLNDITVTDTGDIFVSDSYKNDILVLKNNELSLWVNDSTMQNPNGLLAQGDKMMMVAFGGGQFFRYDLDSKERITLTDSIKGGDGIIALGNDYLVSSWGGEVYHVSDKGEKTLLLDTKAEKINAADIWYIEKKKLLLVPTFFGNRVVAYKVN